MSRSSFLFWKFSTRFLPSPNYQPVAAHQKILCRANLRPGSLVALIYLRFISRQPEQPLQHQSQIWATASWSIHTLFNSFICRSSTKISIDLIIHRSWIWICDQHVVNLLTYTQILNNNPQLILFLIDLQFQSAVKLFICKSSTKSVIDLVTHRSSIIICC